MGHTDGSTNKPRASGGVTDAHQRRLADQRLRDALAAEGFVGPNYDRWKSEMTAYALSVLNGWLASGAVFEMLAARGTGLAVTEKQRRALMADKDEREGIVHEVVAQALVRFRERELVTGRWSAEGGASLATYFMEGAICNEFPNRFRAWQRDFSRRAEPCEDEVLEPMCSGPPSASMSLAVAFDSGLTDPEWIVMSKDGCDAILAELSPRMARIFRYRADGYSYAEIAELEGSTPAAITEAVGRVRRRLREERDERASLNDDDRGGDAR
ncbi:MAG: sigma factor-like helix-turn-helix DNA-binding protein [Nocardioides sp.]|uniref:sigma factor-like helix-turn-helix DNA-binding protein n=1 Tax=Nocardioides sp. TaxID=35761 RepID=UPI003D6C1095